MDIIGTLKNPWVLGGGAALALVVFISSRNASPADQVVNTGTVSNYSGSEWLAASTEIAAGLQVAEIEARTTERLKLFDVMANYMTQQQTVGAQMADTAAGITKSQIEQQGMLQRDRQQQRGRYDELFLTTNAAMTTSMRQADLEELRIKESANLSKLSIGAASEQGKRTLDTTVTLAGIGAKNERLQINAAKKVGLAQARAAAKTGVAQAEAAPWVSFWNNFIPAASQLAGSALKLA